MAKQTVVDCDKLKEFCSEFELDGLDLKIIMNALIVYREWEPETCDTCNDALERLLVRFNEAVNDAMKQTNALEEIDE